MRIISIVAILEEFVCGLGVFGRDHAWRVAGSGDRGYDALKMICRLWLGGGSCGRRGPVSRVSRGRTSVCRKRSVSAIGVWAATRGRLNRRVPTTGKSRK